MTRTVVLASLALALATASSACTSRMRGTESGGAACTNGVDDDGDGATDCFDTDCTTTCAGGLDTGTPGDDAGTPRPDGGGGGCFDPIDLVFVLDVSTSMADEFTHLREGIASIWAAADALTPDHHFGLIVFVDDVLVVNGCAPFASAADLQAEFDSWRTFCSTNGEPGGSAGSNGDCAENSLDALYAAATMCTWRAGATHIAIHVTDDTFLQRPQSFDAGIAVEHTYSETSDALVSAQVRVGAFAQATPAFCGAGTSANTAQGFFVSFGGATPLPDATGGQVWDIADVRSGALDMATAINEMIAAEHCAPF